MKTVDEPGVAGLLARRQARSRSRRCAARVGDIFIVDLETRADHATSPTTSSRDYAPTYSPDGKSIVYIARVSGNEKLFRLDLATKKKTQLTFGTHDDAGGAVHRRPHAGVLVDGDRSDAAARARSRAERQHLQHLDAGPEERRAAAVHRRARRQLVAGRAARAARPAGSRSSPTTRASTASTRSSAKEPLHTVASPTSARPGPIIDFQAPLQHTLVHGEQAQEGHVREDVPRRPAAGERRRHQRRRHLRRHAGQLRRRARRQAVQLLRRVDLAVPHAVARRT